MSILSGLKSYKDRADREKGPMRSWVLKVWDRFDKLNESPLKGWCKCSVVAAKLVYEFLIDNYRSSFAGTEHTAAGLNEIVAYLLFNSVVTGGDRFIEKLKADSISDVVDKVGKIFDFDKSAYGRFNSYIATYTRTGERNAAQESTFLLFAIVTAANPPMKEFPQNLESEFATRLERNVLVFNGLLQQKGLW
jgi:hypothetical protein